MPGCWLLFILLLGNTISYTQIRRSNMQISGSIPGTYSKTFSEILSIESNSAVAVHIKELSTVIYKEQKFLLKELGLFFGAIIKPLPSGTLCFSFQQSGSNDFRETGISMSYCKLLGKADLAVTFNYNKIAATGYKPVHTVSATIAGILHLTEQFHSGFQIQHINSIFSRTQDMRTPAAAYKFGFGYDVSKLVHFSLECTRQQARSMNINAGVAYQIHKKCRLWIGLSPVIPSPFIGVQLYYEGWSLGVKTIYHPQLGISPSMWVSFRQKKKTE